MCKLLTEYSSNPSFSFQFRFDTNQTNQTQITNQAQISDQAQI